MSVRYVRCVSIRQTDPPFWFDISKIVYETKEYTFYVISIVQKLFNVKKLSEPQM